ncbi:MAG TPA: metalloenzyme domain-containing protein, partial [Planctomycetia bacterium]|nr:metalloenzyme domain-containing protein [Planctomycetia bacterium]
MRTAVGSIDLLLVTLDTLRYDAATKLHAAGRTPFLSSLLPAGWEERHSPGSFTFAAHAAFFAGFLPTPARPGVHPRRFALKFPGATTIGPETCVLEGPDIVAGLKAKGYRTICLGGTGFFNRLTPLGTVLPGLFDEAHWEPKFGVTEPDST